MFNLKIREFNPKLIICVSTSGRVDPSFENRSRVLHLEGKAKPDMASLTISSMNFLNEVSVSTPVVIKSLAKLMNEKNILPEIELFDVGMINYMNYLISKRLLPQKNYINLLLGNIAGLQAKDEHVKFAFSEIPGNSVVSLAGLGKHQEFSIDYAIKNGLGIRAGLEDNIYEYGVDGNKNTTSNEKILKSIHKKLQDNSKEYMTSDEFRRHFNL
jgi:uncharacterized protein (DUF849 family)